jgi:hypothetical protein
VKLGPKTGVSWCREHERYETLFEGLARQEDDPHVPDDDPDGPTPSHHEYLEPVHDPRNPRQWLQ